MAKKRFSIEDLPAYYRKEVKQAMKDAVNRAGQKKPIPTARSAAEAEFLLHVKQWGLPTPREEYAFSTATPRKWRFDFAWPDYFVAVEIEGLTHVKADENGKYRLGRHQTLAGYTEDCEKYNQATLEGWRVFHFTPKQVRTLRAIDVVAGFLQSLAEEALSRRCGNAKTLAAINQAYKKSE